MSSKTGYLVKNIGILTVSNFASKIMVFLLVPLYTNILTTTEYGIYDIVISTVQLIFPILTLNITDAVMRFSMDKTCEDKAVISIGITYILRCYLVIVLFVVICSKFQLIDSIVGYEIFIGIYMMSYAANQFLVQLAKGLEKVSDMGIAGVLGTVFLLGGNIVLLLVLKMGLKGFFIANILSQAIPATYLCLRIRIGKYFSIKTKNPKLKKEMLIYCLPLIFSTIGWWVNHSSDKYVVTLLCGAAANGLLSIAYKIPSIISAFQGIFIQAWQISAIKEYGKDKIDKFYGNAFFFVNAIMCILCAGLIILSKPLAQILYAKDFFEAWQYVPFLLVSCVINVASGFLGPILSAAKNSGAMAKSAIYGLIFNIVLNFVLVYYIGIQGATIATVIASVVIYIVRKQAVGADMELTSCWKIYVSWIILCIQAVVEITIMDYFIQAILILFVLLLNRKILSEIFRWSFDLFKKKSKENQ